MFLFNYSNFKKPQQRREKGKKKEIYKYNFRSVSRHELFPIRAPLLALEHCIAPFLDKCDENNDHKISLNEWGKCLELPEVSFPVFFLITLSIRRYHVT